MNRRNTLSLAAVAVLGLTLLPGTALAQQKPLKDQLAGTWTIVSNDNVAPDGTKRQLFGPNPKGLLILAANGQFAQIMVRADRSNFKANNRLEGTAEENKAAVQGTTATFGTWSADEASKTLVVRIEGSMFPNPVGTEFETLLHGHRRSTADQQPSARLRWHIGDGLEAKHNTRQQVTRHSRIGSVWSGGAFFRTPSFTIRGKWAAAQLLPPAGEQPNARRVSPGHGPVAVVILIS